MGACSRDHHNLAQVEPLFSHTTSRSCFVDPEGRSFMFLKYTFMLLKEFIDEHFPADDPF